MPLRPHAATGRVALLLLLSSALLAATAQDVTRSSKVTTNRSSVTRTEFFARTGMTNLIRQTYERDGSELLVLHRVYRGTNLVVQMSRNERGSGLSVSSRQAVDVATEYARDGSLTGVALMDPATLTILDHFSATNGLLTPTPQATIDRANAIARDTAKLFRSVTNSTAAEFVEGVRDLVEKHGGKNPGDAPASR